MMAARLAKVRQRKMINNPEVEPGKQGISLSGMKSVEIHLKFPSN